MARPDWMLDGMGQVLPLMANGKIFCEECGCRHDLDGCGKPECKHCYAQTVKIVINTRFGGFGLSEEGRKVWWRVCGVGDEFNDFFPEDIPRNDNILVQMVEENAELYSGSSSRLRVVEVPADVDWYIVDYDGQEHVAERHRTWS